jgi:mono/diheme cytochrome c family protein
MILGVVLLLVFSLVVFVQFSWDKTFEAPTPTLVASKDSAIIARGKYLAYGPAHCASCHTPMDKMEAVDKGLEMPLIGGFELDIPPATFRASNLTPDKETGIGNFTDGQIARAMRFSVTHNNKVMFPLMPFQNLSDEDVIAVISFLRSQPAVKNKVKPTEFKFLGKALIALGAIQPTGPIGTPVKSIKIDSSIAYGAYLANSVANCVGCHTERDLKTGKNIGAPFAGGLVFEASDASGGYTYVTPNITPDKETGVMASWSEKAFINRIRGGRVYKTSHMPWGSFAKMNDLELKALYRYLNSLAPVKRKVEKVAYGPGEALPKQ